MDRLDQLDARLADIVKTTQEGADVSCPARAASNAWLALKISVQLVGMPSADSTLIAFNPSAVMGIFTTMCFGSSA